MPTIGSSREPPPPKSWDEFEDIALAAAKLRWSSADFYRHGRAGQRQDGVDIYGYDQDGRHIGIQCKNTIHQISLAAIIYEIQKSEKFDPPLDALYIATTTSRDRSIQEDIRKISDIRHSEGKFRVVILFWEDIVQDLATDDDVFFAHYPQFAPKTNRISGHDEFGRVLTNAYRTTIRRLPVTAFTMAAIGISIFVGNAATFVMGFLASFPIQPVGQNPHAWVYPEFSIFITMVSGFMGSIGLRLWLHSKSVGIPFGNLEVGEDRFVYFTRIKADCPLCSGKMSMHSVGKLTKEHTLSCDRNQRHTLVFDMTSLDDVASEYEMVGGERKS